MGWGRKGWGEEKEDVVKLGKVREAEIVRHGSCKVPKRDEG